MGWNRWGTVGRALVVAAALAALAACGSTGDGAAPPSPSTTEPTPKVRFGLYGRYGSVDTIWLQARDRVAMVGDSNTDESRLALHALVPNLRVAAFYGEGFGGGTISDDAGAAVAVEMAAAVTGADVGVLALGTNDAWYRYRPVEETLPILDDVVAALDARCLVVVTVASAPPVDGWDGAMAASINAALEDVGDEVLDWDALTVEPGRLADDGIHLSTDGRTEFATAVAEAVDRCSPRDG